MELYRYKAVCWDESGKNEFTVYGIAAGETPAEAFQRVYDHCFDIVMTISIEFDESNNGVKEMGLEDAKEFWEKMGEF